MARGIIETRIVSPGANTTVTVYDDGDPANLDFAHGKNFHRRIHVALLANQIVTITHNWHPNKGRTPVAFATTASVANTGLGMYVTLLGGRNQVTLTTTTNPTTFLSSVEWTNES
jgi:hypothetical protein